MKTTIKIITPEWAAEILERHNPKNRNLSLPTIEAYCTDMKNGRWLLTHQGIAFDVSGNLVDGQHRLAAIVRYGKPIEMMVTTGLSVQEKKNGVVITTMDSIDRMRTRSIAQQFQISHGIINASRVVAAINAIVAMIKPSKGKVSTASALFVNDIYGSDIQSMIALAGKRWQGGNIIGPLSIYSHCHGEKASQFITECSTLENISSPCRCMIRWFDNNFSSGYNNISAQKVVANCLKAFNGGENMMLARPGEEGRTWLLSLEPSPIRRIREALTLKDDNASLKLN